MLQSLLAERFKLRFHCEKKDLSGFALLVAKNGPKLKASPLDSATADGTPRNNTVVVIGGGRRGVGGGLGGDGTQRNAMASTPSGASVVINKPGHAEGRNQDLSSIADMLARAVDRPVVDETGLKGSFDILDWTPAVSESSPRFRQGGRGDELRAEAGTRAPATADSAAPSLMTALQQQLGLKLEAKRVPVDILVIDHTERMPTEN
jgi:uncharacterized protein (TIGR03435 family)